MRRRLYYIALLLVGLPQGLHALIFGPDDRALVSSQPGTLYGPVGLIFGGSVAGHATAFLISDCHILTVRHAFDPATPVVGAETTFAAGASGDARSWTVTHATVVEAGRSSESNSKDDWALLKLRRCLGRKFGIALVSRRIPQPGHRIKLAGYPNDKSKTSGLVLDPDCVVRRLEKELVRHDCATQPGNSGSPLFDVIEVDGQQRMQVFAMNHAGHSFGVPGANLQRPVTAYHSAYAASALPLPQIITLEGKSRADFPLIR
jgi:glutamyl endopeptidase